MAMTVREVPCFVDPKESERHVNTSMLRAPWLTVSSRYAGWQMSSGVGVVLAVALAAAAAAAPVPPLAGVVAPLVGAPLMEELPAEADADAEAVAVAVAGCAPSNCKS